MDVAAVLQQLYIPLKSFEVLVFKPRDDFFEYPSIEGQRNCILLSSL